MKVYFYCIIIITGVCYSRYTATFANNWIKCPVDCSRVMCNHHKTLKKFCQYGTVYDHCGCCQICALGPDQVCGGLGDLYGKCGPGLYCFPADRHPSQTGRCIPNPICPVASNFTHLMGNLVEVMCMPKCTPDFCSKCPDSICSAIDNVIISRRCQQPCQHTVCQACYFKTKREPPCPKCLLDDFQCMKKFSKCVRKDTCTRHKFPCEPHQKKRSDGRFVCKVPACLT